MNKWVTLKRWLSKTCSKYNYITWNWWIFRKIYYDLKFITNSMVMKKKSSSKYLRSWNLRSKLYLVKCFYTSLLMIVFEDLILMFYIWVPNLTIEVIILVLLLGVWPRKPRLCIPEHLFGPLYYACTHLRDFIHIVQHSLELEVALEAFDWVCLIG